MRVSTGKMFPEHVSPAMRVSPKSCTHITRPEGCVFPISDTCISHTHFTRDACFLDCSATLIANGANVQYIIFDIGVLVVLATPVKIYLKWREIQLAIAIQYTVDTINYFE